LLICLGSCYIAILLCKFELHLPCSKCIPAANEYSSPDTRNFTPTGCIKICFYLQCLRIFRVIYKSFNRQALGMNLNMSRVGDLAAPMHLGLINWPFAPCVQSREPRSITEAPDGPQAYNLNILRLQGKGALSLGTHLASVINFANLHTYRQIHLF